MPCSGRCGESHCPEICLCTEVLQFFSFMLFMMVIGHSFIEKRRFSDVNSETKPETFPGVPYVGGGGLGGLF